jgi:hypothetical protein
VLLYELTLTSFFCIIVQTTLIWVLLAVNISACLRSPSLTPETRTSSAHRRPPPRNLRSTSSKASNTEQSICFASLRVAPPVFHFPSFLACYRSPPFLLCRAQSSSVLAFPFVSAARRPGAVSCSRFSACSCLFCSFSLSLLSSYSRPREREDADQKRGGEIQGHKQTRERGNGVWKRSEGLWLRFFFLFLRRIKRELRDSREHTNSQRREEVALAR